jgi:hypothetical protein
MAQTGFTPIQLYYSSTTTNAPLAANLASGELAINITDGKLFYKDNANAVQVIAWKTTPTSAGGTGLTSYTAGDLTYYASGTAFTKLGIGTAYQALQVNAGATAPSWQPSPTSVLTAQGDLLYASGANTLARLAKDATATRYLSNTGTSNNPAWAQINLANGVTGTLPIANGGTGTAVFPAFNAYQNSSQTPAGATFVKTLLQAENFDTDGFFDSTTNYRFQPTVAGYYQINGVVQFASSVANLIVSIYKNGAEYLRGGIQAPSSFQAAVSGIVYLNGSTDYVELYSFNTTGLVATVATSPATQFSGAMVRSA